MKHLRTVLVAFACLMMTGSGAMDLLQPPDFTAQLAPLGVGPAVMTAIGVGKIAGVLVIALTTFVASIPRWLREWAFAGFTVNMCAALVVHIAAGDMAHAFNPVVPLIVMVAASVLDRKALDAAALATTA